MKKYNDALICLRYALKFESHRYEVHRGMIECFIAQEKFKEAQQQAYKSLKVLGDSPRTLTVTLKTN